MASLAGCAENQVTHTAPETPTTGTDRPTVTGHVLDTTVRTSGEHATVDSTQVSFLPAVAHASGRPSVTIRPPPGSGDATRWLTILPRLEASRLAVSAGDLDHSPSSLSFAR